MGKTGNERKNVRKPPQRTPHTNLGVVKVLRDYLPDPLVDHDDIRCDARGGGGVGASAKPGRKMEEKGGKR